MRLTEAEQEETIRFIRWISNGDDPDWDQMPQWAIKCRDAIISCETMAAVVDYWQNRAGRLALERDRAMIRATEIEK